MAKSGAKKAKSASREVLVVGSKVKDVVKGSGCQSSGDLIDAVSSRVHELLTSAVERAKENGRATVRPYDL